jgi:hypothetical protein
MKTIPLTRGHSAIVDDEDFAELSKLKWFTTRNGGNQLYARRTRPTMSMHRIILKAQPGQQVDHINGNSLDNRRCNLRFANTSQNAANQQKRNGSSQFKGVAIESRTYRLKKRWRARIKLNGKRYQLGYFHTEEEAALAYNQAAKKHFGEFARLNQIEREG